MGRLFESDLGNGEFTNPVLFADYSDPDVIRVEDTYIMTASSFNYIPGLPILISKDLVNWELVNYALKSIPYENYNVPQHSKGVWAPAIRFHNNRFYIYYGMPDEGIFMVSTTDPYGSFDEPVCVLEGKGLIDPCPFWDDDGKAYIIHGYAKSRIGFKSCLGIFEMSTDGKRAITEDHILFDGSVSEPTIEGPKVYKRNDKYYILAPAGGVKQGWQVALKGDSIYGPYEEKKVLEQRDTAVNGPHQGALVDTLKHEEWFVHFQDMGLYGRIIHIQPVTWIDGWPCMGVDIKDYCGKPLIKGKKPDTGFNQTPVYLEASDNFDKKKLSLQWQWMGNASEDFFSLAEREGYLRLYSRSPEKLENPILWDCSNVLTEKLICPEFKCETKLCYSELKENEKAGLIMMGGEYAFGAVKKIGEDFYFVYGVSKEEKGYKTEIIRYSEKLDKENLEIRLSCSLENKDGRVVFKMFKDDELIKESLEFVPSDHTWVGAKQGLFSMGSEGYADFEYFKVESI